jgi:hypothetical protein
VPNCVFLLQSLKGSISGDARYSNNMETRVVIKIFFSARQGAEDNLRPSDINIRRICAIVRHREKLVSRV